MEAAWPVTMSKAHPGLQGLHLGVEEGLTTCLGRVFQQFDLFMVKPCDITWAITGYSNPNPEAYPKAKLTGQSYG